MAHQCLLIATEWPWLPYKAQSILEKVDFLKKLHKIRENIRFWGLGCLGGHFYCKQITRKLLRIILLHFGLVTFRIHYWKTPRPLIFMVLWPGGRDHDSWNQSHFILGDTRTFQIIQEKFPSISKKYVWNLWIGNFVNFWKLCSTPFEILEFSMKTEVSNILNFWTLKI